MANIGDLFFLFRGDDGQLQVDAAKAGDKAGTTGLRACMTPGRSWPQTTPSCDSRTRC